jgi:hypothetical protein
MFEIPRLQSLRPILRLSKLRKIEIEAEILDHDLLPLVSVPTLEKIYLPGRYKSALKKIRADCPCVFKVGRETLTLTKQGPLVLETAVKAKERIFKE